MQEKNNTQHTNTYIHTYKRMNPNIYKSNVEEKDGKCSYQIQRKKMWMFTTQNREKLKRKTASRCAAKKNK